MKIDLDKLNMMLARNCLSLSDLRSGTSPQTLRRICKGEEVKPKTLGRIARALGCDPAELVREEGEEK